MCCSIYQTPFKIVTQAVTFKNKKIRLIATIFTYFYSESRLYSFKDSIKVFALIKTDFIKVQKIQSFRLKHERFGRLDGTRSSDAVSTSSSSNPMMMMLSSSALLFRLFQRCFNAETGAGNLEICRLITERVEDKSPATNNGVSTNDLAYRANQKKIIELFKSFYQNCRK